MSEQTLLDIALLGREYRVSCLPDEREALLKAASYVDEKMREIRGQTQSGGEKLAVMTALNIAHELLQMKLPGGIDLQDFRRRIDSMQSRVDQALALQENLF
ncbi:MAG: cell division protein ZapA [Sterolibacteriaceae bacterium]|uniref:Cell division protein ZapA n=1 Tax=Candidatus Methylophosphatis roskildensis TaxID=2899263 RepID=A0A9D7HL03_9PROT|nr:cell division protein ZapA [Candidatus Methylophosphatis roskildensis]MBK7238461.1 cell division protein ZapA [Sterolibacteriaceae bacterium]